MLCSPWNFFIGVAILPDLCYWLLIIKLLLQIRIIQLFSLLLHKQILRYSPVISVWFSQIYFQNDIMLMNVCVFSVIIHVGHIDCPAWEGESSWTSPEELDYEEQPSDFFNLFRPPLCLSPQPPISSSRLTHTGLLLHVWLRVKRATSSPGHH